MRDPGNPPPPWIVRLARTLLRLPASRTRVTPPETPSSPLEFATAPLPREAWSKLRGLH
ncbi:MAG: hypothetical protein IAE82_20430 [Opitutaceae bacterium]|nr:hypothetical protein [Opitutaceae bacterium]